MGADILCAATEVSHCSMYMFLSKMDFVILGSWVVLVLEVSWRGCRVVLENWRFGEGGWFTREEDWLWKFGKM